MDRNVTKAGLLRLKESKPISITAHTGEIIVPCAYTETVGKFMKSKGIHLPLDPHKLAELRRIAKATPGHPQHDEEGYAKGSANLKKRKKEKVKEKEKKEKESKTKIKGKNIVSGLGNVINIKIGSNKPALRQTQPKAKEVRIPPPLLPDTKERSFDMVRPPNFNLIRPFSTSAPNGNQAVAIQPHPDSLIHKKEQEEKNRKMLEHQKEHFEKLTKDSNDILRRHINQVAHSLGPYLRAEEEEPEYSSSSSTSFTTPNPYIDFHSRVEEVKEHERKKQWHEYLAEDEDLENIRRGDDGKEEAIQLSYPWANPVFEYDSDASLSDVSIEEVKEKEKEKEKEEEKKVIELKDPRGKTDNYEPSTEQVDDWVHLTRTKTLDRTYLDLLYTKKSHHPNVFDFQKIINKRLPRFGLVFGRGVINKNQFIDKIIETMGRYN
jgi:hypothetical protein